MKRITPTYPTDWELGNELLCNVMDNMMAQAHLVRVRHPELGRLLNRQWDELQKHYIKLVGENKALV